jgi:ABC-type multidrug transport system ATPase subunit
MLALGRALMSDPRVLLLDEPSLGLAPLIVDLLFETIGKLCDDAGITILLVEQNASMALELCDRAYVLETGRIRLTGRGSELLNDERVRESYLGCAASEEGWSYARGGHHRRGGGRLYTVDGAFRTAECMAVGGGRVLAVGSAREIEGNLSLHPNGWTLRGALFIRAL